MRIKSGLLGVVLASGMASVLAKEFVIGTLPVAPAAYSNIRSVPRHGNFFDDQYSFVFPAGAVSASGSVITLDVGNILNIDNLKLALFHSDYGLVAAGADGESSLIVNQPLWSGSSYYFSVSGVVLGGAAGGSYAFLASADPIPEASTLAMALAGVAIFGTALRRRGAV